MAFLRTILVRRRGTLVKIVLALPALWLLLNIFTINVSKPSETHNVEERREDPIIEEGNQRVPVKVVHKPEPAIEIKPVEPKTEKPPEPEKEHEIHAVQDVLLPPQEPNGPGEMGKPVVLPKDLDPETKKLVDKGWQDNAFNEYVSNKISLHRSLPDPRDEWCKAPGRYLENLPATAVIVCFHNEAFSVLMRTMHSILDRSPEHLLKEIILVDDKSDMPHLGQQLEDYVAQYPKVRIVRAQKREGLIRARLMGAAAATAPVLTFLDSHCECAQGWLEPLLDRIALSSTNVVCPIIDTINDNTFEVGFKSTSFFSVGGFSWGLIVGMIDIELLS